jgi:hypothetical protein
MLSSSANSSSAEAHDRALADAVARALALGRLSFRDVLEAVDGADPPSVLSVLELLAANGQPAGSAARAAILEARTAVAELPTALPISHPLDYAWMFSEHTQAELVDRIAALTVRRDLVAHLGTPTLHKRALRALPDRRHVLFDRDQRRVDAANACVAGSAQHVDFLRGSPAASNAALAIADPPWYPQPALAFTHAASVVLRADAQLLLAFPARLTRPGIREDRENLVRAAAKHAGMRFVGVEPKALRYDTPAFERAAMCARGIPGTPTDWRVGDLLTLERTSRPSRARDMSHAHDWLAVEIDAIPLRAQALCPPSGDRLLGALVDGDVLASVSGRAPERSQAALWTSRNRVYRSADPRTLVSVVRAIADHLPLPRDPEIQASARMIADIVALERREHGLPVRDVAVAT